MKIFGNDYNTPDGTCIRDYIHIEDLIDAHILALKYLKNGGKSDVFNLGTGTGFSNMQVVEAARKITGCPIPVDITERRPGDPDILVASGDKAKKILGWIPKKPTIEDIISSAWKWHSTHPEGF
jgi:UDP-glucose 4-epimerase